MRRPAVVVALLPLTVVAAACVPEERRDDTILYASGAELQSINPLLTTHPLAKQVQKFVLFTTLARYDEHLVAQPYLSRAWRWSPDGRRLRLELAPGVRWHDGRPTRARDVAWTLDAARDPATAYPRSTDLASVAAVHVVDSLTVDLVFREPRSEFPDVLTDLAIVPEHLLGEVPPAELRAAPFNAAPVGNGPFRFIRHEPNRRWVFERNEAFPAALGGPPRLERLVIAIVDEPTTKLAALTARELDVAGINPAHADFVRRIDYLEVRDYPVLMTYLLILNLRRAPFDDRRVREAISLAIDREAIVAAYLYGFGEPAWGPIPPAHPQAMELRRVPYAPDSARRLLANVGVTPERPLAFEIVTVATGENPLEQMIQAQLASIGVTVRLRPLELGAFLARAQSAARDFDALVTGIPGDLALSHVRGLFDSRRADEPLGYAGYRNPRMDAALDADRWGEVQRLAVRDQPVVFLYHARGVQGVARRLQDAAMDLRGELPTVQRWFLDGARQ